MKEVSMENWCAPSELRGGGGSTCGDNAEGKAASLVKILTGDCQRGCVDQTTTQAYGRREDKDRQKKNLAHLKGAFHF